MSPGYRYTLDEACCEVFNLLPRRERERLLEHFCQLAAHPFTQGDYHEADTRGLPLELMLVENEFLVTWHADHAAKQVRIVALDVV